MRLLLAGAILLPIGMVAFTGGDDKTGVASDTTQLVEVPQKPTTTPASGESLERVPSTPPLSSPSQQDHPSQIAKLIIVALVRNTESDEEWGTRIARSEIAPLINKLYLARKMGHEPGLATYDPDAFTPEDRELVDQLQQAIEKRPDLNLLVEGILRQYDLMHCETLDAALRSWLVPG